MPSKPSSSAFSEINPAVSNKNLLSPARRTGRQTHQQTALPVLDEFAPNFGGT
jgi:hypothetical protein